MADTVSISALRKAVWIKELMQDVQDNLYFKNKGLMGPGDNNIVCIKDDLKKEMGDTIHFGLTAKIAAAGITGDNTAEGNELAISSYEDNVIIDQIRYPVRLTGKLDEQRVAYDMRMDAKQKIAIALAEFIERQIFMKLGGVTTLTLTDTNSVTYSGQATWSNAADIYPAADEAAGVGSRYFSSNAGGLDALTNTDIFTVNLITRAKVKAQLASPMIRPLRIDGEDWYVMFIHPWQAADLKTASGSVWAQAQRDAQARGKDNPIFTGALGTWDGVVLFAHEYVPTAQATAAFGVGGTASPTGVRAFRSLLCGRQAIGYAECGNDNAWVEKTFDFGNKVGFCGGMLAGLQKLSFNSKEFGVIAVDTGATAIS